MINQRLLAALKSVVVLAEETRKEWDADNDSRVGKILMALSGTKSMRNYRKDVRQIHEAIEAAEAAPTFTARVYAWVLEAFGPEVAANKKERNHRFLEEALELVQSLGCTKADALLLLDYVYSREVGEPNQECGGVMVTLGALCGANGIDVETAAETELARVWEKIEQIRIKQATKPRDSALPMHYAPRLEDSPLMPYVAHTTACWINHRSKKCTCGLAQLVPSREYDAAKQKGGTDGPAKKDAANA